MRKLGLPVLVSFLCGVLVGAAVFGGRVQDSRPGSAPPTPAPPEGADPGELASLRAQVAALEARLSGGRPSPAVLPSPSEPVRLAEGTPDPATAVLRVDVRGPEGPLRGVPLHLFSETGKSAQAETSEDGRAVLDGLTPGRWKLSARFEGTFREIETVLTAGRCTDVSVSAPEGEAVVTGRLLDARTGPIGGATVSLTSTGVWTDFARVTTEEDGTFRFERVSEGPAELMHSPGTLARMSVRIELRVPRTGALRRDVVVGVVSLHGTVRDSASGLPIRGVSVRLQCGSSAQTTTDHDGVFSFEDLYPANLEVVFARNGYGIRVKPVSVRDGEATEFNINLDPAAALIFTVRDPRGLPYTGQLFLGIRAEGKGTNIGMGIPVDAEGHSEFRMIVPGEYELTFTVAGVGKSTVRTRVSPGDNSLEVRLE